MNVQPLDTSPNFEKLRAYHSFLDKWNQLTDPQPEDMRWQVEKILSVINVPVKHGRSVHFKVQFQEGDKAWVNMDNLRVDDPHTVIAHAIAHNMLDDPGFEWMKDYLAMDDENFQLIQAFKTAKREGTEKKFQFGVEVPRNPKQTEMSSQFLHVWQF